ncbi:MAG: hypothetical protein ACJAYU_003129 [Bradymonadia bacterium]|jgi:hypothetical protein
MNGHAERFVGIVRHELLNHVIVLNENHLRRLTTPYVSYYHHDRSAHGARQSDSGEP